MSTLSAFPYIQERSEATPGLWNLPFSIISANMAALNTASGFSTISVTTLAASSVSLSGMVKLNADSASTDYFYFRDSSNARSNYILGSHIGGTADGLNIYDASGATMLVSFSKQSIRFYQNIVGPVFDVGGALSDTLNAATFGTGADSKETRIQAAITAAVSGGIHRVYVPASMVSYNARVMSFSTKVQMIREGGNPDVCDIIAYGAQPSVATSSTSAIQAAMQSAHSQGRVCYIPAGSYGVENLYFYPSSMVKGGGSGSGTVPISQLFQASAATAMWQPLAPGTRTNNFAIEDVFLSAFGNTTNQGLIDGVNCLQFWVRRVSFSGASRFAIRVVGGTTSGDAGFGLIEDCEFNSLQAGGTEILLQASTNDQPDGVVVANSYFNAGSKITWVGSIATVGIGAGTFTMIGCRCESSTSFISIFSGEASNAKFVANRFETTASNATLGVTLFPATAGGGVLVASFFGNSYAAPSGVSWLDTATVKSVRFADDETGGRVFNTAQDGSRLNPAWSFSSENSLGWYRSANSTMELSYGDLAVQMGSGTNPKMRFISRFGGGGGWSANANSASAADSASFAGWIQEFSVNPGSGDGITWQHHAAGGGFGQVASMDSTGAIGMAAGIATNPGMRFESEKSFGFYRSGASRMDVSYGQLSVNSGSNTTPGLGFSSTSVGFYYSGAQTIAQSLGTLNLATNAARLSMRTLAVSSVTLSAANTNIATDEVVFTIGGASGASLCISSGGTTYIFNSAMSAKNT